MARPSRAERRRMSARDATVQAAKRPTQSEVADVVQHSSLIDATVAPSDASSVDTGRTIRTTRRMARVPEHVDYTGEYTIIAHDLRRIALWGIIMIAIMIGIKYSGLV